MILGIGSDIIDIRRIEKAYKKNGEQFLLRIFSDDEIKAAEKYKDNKKRFAHFAKRFAAKEAMAKALGTGIGEGVSFKDAVISNLESGKPVMTLMGKGARTLKSLSSKTQIDVSLSDDYPFAQAIVIISSL